MPLPYPWYPRSLVLHPRPWMVLSLSYPVLSYPCTSILPYSVSLLLGGYFILRVAHSWCTYSLLPPWYLLFCTPSSSLVLILLYSLLGIRELLLILSNKSFRGTPTRLSSLIFNILSQVTHPYFTMVLVFSVLHPSYHLQVKDGVPRVVHTYFRYSYPNTRTNNTLESSHGLVLVVYGTLAHWYSYILPWYFILPGLINVI